MRKGPASPSSIILSMRTASLSRTLTFLFTDLEESTYLWGHFPEAMPSALARHDALLRGAVETHAGRVVKTTGDGLHAAFASAADAVAAALDAQRALLREPWPGVTGPLRVRIGLHTGESQEREGDYYGSEVNRAARLMSIGHGGQVLLSGATAVLVRDQLPPEASLLDLGEHRLRDLEHAEHVFQLAHPDLRSDFPPLRSLSAYKHNLPAQLSTFVGRQKELAEISDLLGHSRLVSLTGPGGTGKTRLSLQVAAEQLDAYQDGVFFVDLTVLNDPSQIVSAIAETLGLRELRTESLLDTVERHLQDKQLLLLLDNFEHLIEGASVVGDILTAAPSIDMLVTSREVLRLSGESTYPVRPLHLPEPGRKIALKELANYEAAQLFVQRAQAANPAFELSEQNAPAIVEICRHLDGLPLAIELAAARSRMFQPAQLLERLSDQLKFLRGGARDLPARQQTLRGAIDWSYDLLDEAERTLFARLAIFSGGGVLEAIESVCGDPLGIAVIDGLESLLDKSLIRQSEDFEGQPRFGMLETIHTYASQLLREREDWPEVRAAHARWVLAFAQQAEEGLFGEDSDEWIQRIRSEEGNLRAVLQRCKSGLMDPELGVRLAGRLRYYWETTDKLTEGRAWLDAMLSISAGAPDAARAAAVCGAGVLAYWQGDWPNCGKWCERAVELGQKLGDRFILGEAQHFLGHFAQNDGEFEQGLALLRRSFDNFSELEHPWGMRRSKNCLGDAERLTQNYDRAARIFQELIEDYEGKTKDVLYAATLSNYGNVLNRQGEYEGALASFQKGIEFAWELENATLLGFLFDGLAGTTVLAGQPERAAELMAASRRAFGQAGVTSMNSIDQFDHDHYMAAIREQIDAATLDAILASGDEMSLEAAVALALETRLSDQRPTTDD
jgi:predicted ATPase/class 3 adenylate cyclase